MLADSLAFRGGTALHKLYFAPAPRYSEDIDLVQIHPEPIGLAIDRLREILAYLEQPKIKQKDRNTTLLFRFETEVEPVIRMRLKIEINCREHKFVFGPVKKNYTVDSPWFAGSVDLTTFELDELLATKVRALYQRRRGRDLFDLWYADQHADIDWPRVMHAFRQIMKQDGTPVTNRQFQINLEEKLAHPDFFADIQNLLRPELQFEPKQLTTDFLWNGQ
ncbi:MAG: nucleotidyl transferase AbiEii/AbiGii toxin family protein [Kiritimatiellales bacterium]|nr:nucleotidyl transferase AbiEii/AbiGii toxin family protein [Kiritimatiellales bacterium]